MTDTSDDWGPGRLDARRRLRGLERRRRGRVDAPSRTLRDQLGLVTIIEVEPEDYFDYQFNRPRDRLRRQRRPRAHLAGRPCSPAPRTARRASTCCSAPSRRAAGRPSPRRSLDAISVAGIERHRLPRRDARRRSAHPPHLGLRLERERLRARALRPRALAATRAPSASSRCWRMRRSAPASPRCRSGRRCRTTCTTRRPPRPPSRSSSGSRTSSTSRSTADPSSRTPTAWEKGIDALASDDDDMSAYIEQLEQARDTVDSPEAIAATRSPRSSRSTCASATAIPPPGSAVRRRRLSNSALQHARAEQHDERRRRARSR